MGWQRYLETKTTFPPLLRLSVLTRRKGRLMIICFVIVSRCSRTVADAVTHYRNSSRSVLLLWSTGRVHLLLNNSLSALYEVVSFSICSEYFEIPTLRMECRPACRVTDPTPAKCSRVRVNALP
jgi:hypothetical protein